MGQTQISDQFWHVNFVVLSKVCVREQQFCPAHGGLGQYRGEVCQLGVV